MAWLKNLIEWISNLFSGQKVDPAEIQLNAILESKDNLAVKMKDLSDEADRLNEEFKSIMAKSDEDGLKRIKARFQEINSENLKHRHTINKYMQDLRGLQSSSKNPAIEEAMDEFSEMIKNAGIIMKHHKAIQHVEITRREPKEKIQGEPEEAKPAEAKPSQTPLENMQSQATVLIQVPEDLKDFDLKKKPESDTPSE